MNATTTNLLTVMELLGDSIPNGQTAVVTTENSFYGITVVKHGNTLINKRTGKPLTLSAELLKTKFRLVSSENEVSFNEFLNAYKEGKKLKITVDGKSRHIQKQDINVPEEIQSLVNNILPFGTAVIGHDDIMTFNELINGKFYIVD